MPPRSSSHPQINTLLPFPCKKLVQAALTPPCTSKRLHGASSVTVTRFIVLEQMTTRTNACRQQRISVSSRNFLPRATTKAVKDRRALKLPTPGKSHHGCPPPPEKGCFAVFPLGLQRAWPLPSSARSPSSSTSSTWFYKWLCCYIF